MSTTQHPLTETDAAEMWDAHVGHTVPWDDWYGGSRLALTTMLRAAFDAGREHERTTPAGKQLMAEVWAECADEAHALGWLHGAAREDLDNRNPYRP